MQFFMMLQTLRLTFGFSGIRLRRWRLATEPHSASRPPSCEPGTISGEQACTMAQLLTQNISYVFHPIGVKSV